MKILICTNSLGAMGGIERVTIVKANALADIPGNEVMVCYTDKGTFPQKTIHPVSCKVRTADIGVPFWTKEPMSFFCNILFSLRRVIKYRNSLCRILNQFKPDIIVSTGQYEKYILPFLPPCIV